MAIRPLDPDVVEQHVTGDDPRLGDFAHGLHAHLLKFRDARRCEAFAVRETLLVDFEDVAPVLLSRLVADISNARSVEWREARHRTEDQSIDFDQSGKEDMQNRNVQVKVSAEPSQPVARLEHVGSRGLADVRCGADHGRAEPVRVRVDVGERQRYEVSEVRRLQV